MSNSSCVAFLPTVPMSTACTPLHPLCNLDPVFIDSHAKRLQSQTLKKGTDPLSHISPTYAHLLIQLFKKRKKKKMGTTTEIVSNDFQMIFEIQ